MSLKQLSSFRLGKGREQSLSEETSTKVSIVSVVKAGWVKHYQPSLPREKSIYGTGFLHKHLRGEAFLYDPNRVYHCVYQVANEGLQVALG